MRDVRSVMLLDNSSSCWRYIYILLSPFIHQRPNNSQVAIFIIIELFVFPLGCGIMLDLCTLKLFPNATLRSRMVFFAHAPVTAVFYHWMVGTMFMYVTYSRPLRKDTNWFCIGTNSPFFLLAVEKLFVLGQCGLSKIHKTRISTPSATYLTVLPLYSWRSLRLARSCTLLWSHWVWGVSYSVYGCGEVHYYLSGGSWG